jgi:hypothetical protein
MRLLRPPGGGVMSILGGGIPGLPPTPKPFGIGARVPERRVGDRASAPTPARDMRTAIFLFVKQYCEALGEGPTIRQVRGRVGATTDEEVSEHVDRLVADGYLYRDGKVQRSLVVKRNYP